MIYPAMCLSCRNNADCERIICRYSAPEPTRDEWTKIYKEALRKLREACDTQEKIHRIGRVKALRDALIEIHGFSKEEIEGMEEAG